MEAKTFTILVLGAQGTGKAAFIAELKKEQSARVSEDVDIALVKAPAGYLPNDWHESNMVIILAAVDDEDSFDAALALASEIDRPKIIVGNKADLPRAIPSEEAKVQAHEVDAPYIEVSCEQPNFQGVMGMIVNEIEKQRVKKEKRCRIRMKRSTIRHLQTVARFLSVLCMIDGLAIIMSASVEFIKETKVWPSQTIFDSMIIGGMITFVISFIGFYGCKKAGIKEYLKAFYLIMIGVCIYKIGVLIVYSIYALPESTLSEISIPLLASGIFIDTVTIIVVFLYKNAVKKVGLHLPGGDDRSISII